MAKVKKGNYKKIACKVAQGFLTVGAHDKITKDYNQEVSDEVWQLALELYKYLKDKENSYGD